MGLRNDTLAGSLVVTVHPGRSECRRGGLAMRHVVSAAGIACAAPEGGRRAGVDRGAPPPPLAVSAGLRSHNIPC